MLVKEIMTHRLDFIERTDTVQEAALKMKFDNVGALPVFDSNYLVGIITDRDIAIRCTAAAKDSSKTKVSEIMTENVFFCVEDCSIEQAAEIMEKNQVRRLIVKNSEGHVTGMVSLTDLAKGFNKELASEVLQKISTPAHPEWF